MERLESLTVPIKQPQLVEIKSVFFSALFFLQLYPKQTHIYLSLFQGHSLHQTTPGSANRLSPGYAKASLPGFCLFAAVSILPPAAHVVQLH